MTTKETNRVFNEPMEKSIIFYSDYFTPMSNGCYGCYHYWNLCNGSVFGGGECPAGIVIDLKPSVVAFQVLEETDNRFVIARAFGYNISELIKVEDLADDELREEYAQALTYSEKQIQELQDKYDVKAHLLSPVDNSNY